MKKTSVLFLSQLTNTDRITCRKRIGGLPFEDHGPKGKLYRAALAIPMILDRPIPADAVANIQRESIEHIRAILRAQGIKRTAMTKIESELSEISACWVPLAKHGATPDDL